MSILTGPPGGGPARDNLAIPEIIDQQSVARIREVLSADSWRWLTRTIRAAWEKDLSRQRVRVDLSALSESETAAMADFLGWATHKIGTVTISLLAMSISFGPTFSFDSAPPASGRVAGVLL